MRIAIFSDCHCGFGQGERAEDCFSALEQAIEKSLDCDLILLAGDIFDSRVPKQEILARTAKILGRAQHFPTVTKLVKIINKKKSEISPLALRGIPIVAIHGTHERRSRHLINPLQALEHAGLLIHLHCATLIFDIGGEKVAIHGMSGVPERYAKDCLLEWDPKPIDGAKNILMIHQSVDPYIYSPLEPPSLSLEDLPDGFDLYILGHIHWSDKKDFKSGILLLPGSTVPTTLHKIESKQKKGIWKFSNDLEFFPIEQRPIIWKEFSYNENIKSEISRELEKINFEKKPIVVLKIKGKLPTGATISFRDTEERFKEKMILHIDKKLQPEQYEEKVELLRALREQRLSPEERGLQILKENLAQAHCVFKPEELFDLLVDGNIDLTFNLLTGKQKKLK